MLTALSTIFSITLLELMLSVDNALVNASLAEDLPRPLQKKAIYVGIGMGAFLRIVCLFFATLIIKYPLFKLLGGLYLCFLAYSHFFRTKKEEKELKKHPHFWRVIIAISLADLVFSVDNVIGAVGISQHYAYVVFGVVVGIITMLFVTPIMLALMNRFPSLIKAAYAIIAYIGILLLADVAFHFHIKEYISFMLILVVMIITIQHDAMKRRRIN